MIRHFIPIAKLSSKLGSVPQLWSMTPRLDLAGSAETLRQDTMLGTYCEILNLISQWFDRVQLRSCCSPVAQRRHLPGHDDSSPFLC